MAPRVLGMILHRVLGVLHRVLGVLHRVLGLPHRVLGVLHRVLGVPHRVLGVLHRVLGYYTGYERVCVWAVSGYIFRTGAGVFPRVRPEAMSILGG